MQRVTEQIPVTVSELAGMSAKMFEGLVKAVVDVEREIMLVDADMHADFERIFLEEGSKQEDLWGINLYPGLAGDDFLEIDSMINIRPRQGNRSCGVEDPVVQKRIQTLVSKLVV